MGKAMLDPKRDLLGMALERALKDYYGENGERLPRTGVEAVVGDQAPVKQPAPDEASDD